MAQTSNPFAGDKQAAELGSTLFNRHCSSCHGKSGQAGRAPDLNRGSFNSGDQDADLFRTISQGLPGTEMSGYADRLGAENIWRIIAFLRSVNVSEAPYSGDPARGERLFWGKAGCGNCHAVGNRGNHVGPDLSTIGRRRSLEYLLQSLVDPDADIVPDYGSVTVISLDGRTTRGIERAFDEFSVVLQDFSGKVYSFPRTRLRSATEDQKSLMPGYGKTLSAEEINELMAYLSRLGRTRVKR